MNNDRISDFELELKELINKHLMESFSKTPDYILARYILECLEAYNVAVIMRDNYHK